MWTLVLKYGFYISATLSSVLVSSCCNKLEYRHMNYLKDWLNWPYANNWWYSNNSNKNYSNDCLNSVHNQLESIIYKIKTVQPGCSNTLCQIRKEVDELIDKFGEEALNEYVPSSDSGNLYLIHACVYRCGELICTLSSDENQEQKDMYNYFFNLVVNLLSKNKVGWFVKDDNQGSIIEHIYDKKLWSLLVKVYKMKDKISYKNHFDNKSTWRKFLNGLF